MMRNLLGFFHKLNRMGAFGVATCPSPLDCCSIDSGLVGRCCLKIASLSTGSARSLLFVDQIFCRGGRTKLAVSLFVSFLFITLCCAQTRPLPDAASQTHLSPEQIKRKNDEARYRSTLLFANALELIRDEYVDQSKIDYDELTYAALRGMLNWLDPHSQFMDPNGFEAMKTDTEGRFGGLGVSVGIMDGYLTVHMPIDGGPGERAGLRPADRIVKINGQSTRRMNLSDAIKRMRGEPGQKIALTIYRPSAKRFLEFNIEREYIDIPTVKDVYLIDEPSKIAYLRITQFGDHTVEEFDRALQQLEKQGMRSLIIDLRDNPGGLLDAAVEVAGRFLPVGTPVVSTEGRPGTPQRVFTARGTLRYLNLPLVVLINGNSASGAEIVAGALKDMHRAILMGETTFGKGSVQTIQPMENFIDRPVALRLTTAKYYTPSHKLIHEVGVSPDIKTLISREDERDLFLKKTDALLPESERKRVEAVQDRQLERALYVALGLQVFLEKTR